MRVEIVFELPLMRSICLILSITVIVSQNSVIIPDLGYYSISLFRPFLDRASTKSLWVWGRWTSPVSSTK